MKFDCRSCGAKYSIADEKVAGKVFKVRCKSCGEGLILRAKGGEEALWHLAIEGQERGPMTTTAVAELYASGAIQLSTYAWREGLSDWQALGELDAFAELLAPRPDEPCAEAKRALAETQVLAETDTLADTETLAETHLKSQRNESSVLFSLGNLSSLARTPATAGPAASSLSSAKEGASGLIDIRSMASLYRSDGPRPPASAAEAGAELPVFAEPSLGGAQPLLLPTPAATVDKRLLYSLVGAVAVLGLAAVMLLVLVLKSDNSATASNVSPAAPTLDAAPVATSANDAPRPRPEPEPATLPLSAVQEEPGTAPEAATPAPAAPPEKARVRGPKTGQPQGAADESEGGGARAATNRGAKACDEITCLVDPSAACCAALPSPQPRLPEKLSESEIRAGIDSVRGRIASCASRHAARGKLRMKIVIAGSGRVESAQSSDLSPALRKCVASALERMRLKKTRKGRSFTYPFVFR